MLSIDGIRTLVNMVIVDPIQVDLVLWGCYDSCGSNKGWSLSQLVFDGHVSPFSCRGFWMSTIASKQVFSLMYQCGMKSKRALKAVLS